MIYGKINPPAEKIDQVTPFSSVTYSADIMAVVARPYILGSNQVNFVVWFGNATVSGTTVTDYLPIMNSNIVLSGEEITTWGTDDSKILRDIAVKLGTSVTDVLSGDTSPFLG